MFDRFPYTTMVLFGAAAATWVGGSTVLFHNLFGKPWAALGFFLGALSVALLGDWLDNRR